jgi:glycosyltransferase involved in cell wall biosynthesis
MLAIVIPYYKVTFFEATLESLSNQTDKRFKVYIGDDASPEDPVFLLEKYQGKFEFVYNRFEENLGGTSLVKHWERCIALSGNEEWIMILGDDDVFGDEVVWEFYRNLPEVEQEGIKVVRFSTQVIDGEGKVISGVFEHPKLEKATDSFFRKFTGNTRSSLSEYVFSRMTYTKFEFRDYPLGWFSDDIAWLDFADCNPILSINTAQLFIRISSSSISGKNDNEALKKKASNCFNYYFYNVHLIHFSKKQRLQLIQKFEYEYFKQKQKQKVLFFKIVKYHIKYTDIFNLVKFFRRIYLNR